MKKDGIIQLNSPFAKELGFTSDKFWNSWLWKTGDRITISMIWVRPRLQGKGYFTQLLKAIWDKGYEVAIPTSLGIMNGIVRKNGFQKTMVFDKNFNDYVELWVK